jgi:hypothetical protein
MRRYRTWRCWRPSAGGHADGWSPAVRPYGQIGFAAGFGLTIASYGDERLGDVIRVLLDVP